MSTALLHIGTHKTGTTSFQRWARDNRDSLQTRGIRFYEPLWAQGGNAGELVLLCLRANRSAPHKPRHPESCLDEWRELTTRHLAEQVSCSSPDLLISAESLSLLRYEDEIRTLQQLLAPRTLRVAVCLRDRASFLESYEGMLRRAGQAPSRFPSSHAYLEPDTWLVRWDEMLSTWATVVGGDNVTSFGYEEALANDGTTIPGVLRALGVAPAGLPESDAYWENATADLDRRETSYRRARRASGRTPAGGVVRRVVRGRSTSTP